MYSLMRQSTQPMYLIQKETLFLSILVKFYVLSFNGSIVKSSVFYFKAVPSISLFPGTIACGSSNSKPLIRQTVHTLMYISKFPKYIIFD